MPSQSSFLGQLWKEYALSDSRYMSADPLVLIMESWTVVTWGPLSILTAVLITRKSHYRHPIQALVSTGQFYGNLLYFSTSLYEDFIFGKQYYRPEPFYFWVYFVGMNAIWLVVPGCELSPGDHRTRLTVATGCLCRSTKETARAFAMAHNVRGILDASKHTKKRS